MGLFDEEPENFWRDLGGGKKWKWTSENHTGIWLTLSEDCTIQIPLTTEGGNVPKTWELVSKNPLTITPSIQTLRGAAMKDWHGYITNGEWIDC